MVKLGNSWDALLADEFSKEYYQTLRRKLYYEYKTQTVYPDMYHLFEALKLTAYEDVRAVILGQDPYIGPGQAHGLAFSVQRGVPVPPSLANIYRELQSQLGCNIPSHGNLEGWAEQGVLLLNATLSVREGLSNSHATLGWQIFTDRVVELLAARKEPMVFLLWGRNAQRKAGFVGPPHLVLQSAHPSPLSASRGFFGNGHFRETNAFLMKYYGKGIDWQIYE